LDRCTNEGEKDEKREQQKKREQESEREGEEENFDGNNAGTIPRTIKTH
jgi:hypothetical protein